MECMATGQNVNFTDYGHTGQERRHVKAKIICSVAKIAGCMLKIVITDKKTKKQNQDSAGGN